MASSSLRFQSSARSISYKAPPEPSPEHAFRVFSEPLLSFAPRSARGLERWASRGTRAARGTRPRWRSTPASAWPRQPRRAGRGAERCRKRRRFGVSSSEAIALDDKWRLEIRDSEIVHLLFHRCRRCQGTTLFTAVRQRGGRPSGARPPALPRASGPAGREPPGGRPREARLHAGHRPAVREGGRPPTGGFRRGRPRQEKFETRRSDTHSRYGRTRGEADGR